MLPLNNPLVQCLQQAIQGTHPVTVLYDDKERTVEPHAVGVNKNGEIIFRAYQTFATRDSAIGWKLMKINKVQQMYADLGLSFGQPRQGYKKDDPAMTEIVAQL